MLRDIAAGLFCVLLGAALALAWVYRKEIRVYLKLQNDGTIDNVTQLTTSAQALYEKIVGNRPKPAVGP